MRRHATLLLIAVGILCGAATGLWLARGGGWWRVPAPEPLLTLSGASEGARPPHALGPEEARVTLEEFGDFQCPPCGRLHPELKKLEEEYGPRLRVIFRQYPLESHAHARESALAAEAAAAQGKFWEMHDLLFVRQDEWALSPDPRPLFAGYARSLGMDEARFSQDAVSARARERLGADLLRGDSAKVSATPTLFINDSEIPADAMTPEGIRAAINAALPPDERRRQ